MHHDVNQSKLILTQEEVVGPGGRGMWASAQGRTTGGAELDKVGKGEPLTTRRGRRALRLLLYGELGRLGSEG